MDAAKGNKVKRGERLLVLQAMKMEYSLVAPFDGTVADLNGPAGSQVKEGRFGAHREGKLMAGRFEQWKVGDRIAHDMGRTVTETDNLLINTLTHNPQPLHLDAEYAATTEFGRIVVNGLFTLSLMVGISVNDTTFGTLVANLGYDEG